MTVATIVDRLFHGKKARIDRMSMISEQANNIRSVAKSHKPYVPSVVTEMLTEAADTIEALSKKTASGKYGAAR